MLDSVEFSQWYGIDMAGFLRVISHDDNHVESFGLKADTFEVHQFDVVKRYN